MDGYREKLVQAIKDAPTAAVADMLKERLAALDAGEWSPDA